MKNDSLYIPLIAEGLEFSTSFMEELWEELKILQSNYLDGDNHTFQNNNDGITDYHDGDSADAYVACCTAEYHLRLGCGKLRVHSE